MIMKTIDSKTAYKAPKAKVLFVKTQGLLCQSEPVMARTIDIETEEGNENW